MPGHKPVIAIGVVLALGGLAAPSTAPQTSVSPHRSVAVDPIDAVLEAFRSHRLVALGEGAHGNLQGHAFRLALVRDPRFGEIVDDIVVEFGNALYQPLMDRFVEGESIDDESLRQVWQNTTQAQPAWDAPIYEEFFRAVRAVNTSVPADRRIRVLLGDPPIDWHSVRSAEDLRRWEGRGRHAAEIIRREVLEKRRRALIIYGDAHLFRVPMSETIVSLLEADGTHVFTIASPVSMPGAADLESIQSDVRSWRVPGLTILRGTLLGETPFSFYYPPPKMLRDGAPVAMPLPDQWRDLRMEDQFDALLYLGPSSSIGMTSMVPALCQDSKYMEMRIHRMELSGMQGQIDRLKQYCAAARK
jgi:hypothetical protein